MNKQAQYRVAIPPGKNIEQMRSWCKKNLNGQVKLTWKRRFSKVKGKWVRDYASGPMFRFREEGDAMAFKLIWFETDE